MTRKREHPDEVKQVVSVRMRPSLVQKAKRLNLNLSKVLQSAIEEMPELSDEKSA